MLKTKQEAVERGALRLRQGHGANCSSIGSVIDLLFATAAVGGAIFAAVSATLSEETVDVVVAKSDRESPEAAEEPRE